MSPLYEDEIATGDFAHVGESLTRVGFRLGLPGADDDVANAELEKALKTVECPGGLGWAERCEIARGLAVKAWARGRLRCESPIEKALLPWLICQPYQFFEFHPAVLLPGETELYVPGTLAVIPQLPIGRYRVDFALAGSLGGPIRFVVIECDGKEFHDGVENVKRDLDRDVAILGNKRVLDVLRLDGRDILRDPQGSAHRAAKAVLEAWRR